MAWHDVLEQWLRTDEHELVLKRSSVQTLYLELVMKPVLRAKLDALELAMAEAEHLYGGKDGPRAAADHLFASRTAARDALRRAGLVEYLWALNGQGLSRDRALRLNSEEYGDVRETRNRKGDSHDALDAHRQWLYDTAREALAGELELGVPASWLRNHQLARQKPRS